MMTTTNMTTIIRLGRFVPKSQYAFLALYTCFFFFTPFLPEFATFSKPDIWATHIPRSVRLCFTHNTIILYFWGAGIFYTSQGSDSVYNSVCEIRKRPRRLWRDNMNALYFVGCRICDILAMVVLRAVIRSLNGEVKNCVDTYTYYLWIWIKSFNVCFWSVQRKLSSAINFPSQLSRLCSSRQQKNIFDRERMNHTYSVKNITVV